MPDDAAAPKNDADRDLAAALHEVGNGLTVILGWLEEARRHAGEGPVADALVVALERARRSHRVARRAIGADVGRPLAEPIVDLVRECVLGLSPAAAQRRIALTPVVAPGLTTEVEAGERLLIVLTNLVLNALEATGPGGSVSVAVHDGSEGEIELRVEDGGPGIPEAERERVFQRGATGRVGGAGIGLAHALRITEEEGARLELAPYDEGRGAVFVLSWPIATSPMKSGPHTRRAAQLEGCRVAVVDDDRGVLELLDMVLTARGATVATYTCHEELVAALPSAPIDVALLDASPYGSSLEPALTSLKRDHAGLGVILISGASDPGVAVEKLGVTWIRKPFEVDEVVDVVRVVRGSSRSGT